MNNNSNKITSRPEMWDALFMRFAADVANMSWARRLKVGAVAVRDLRVIAIGFNGTPKGEDNCCEELVEELDTVTTSMQCNYNPSEHREWIDGRMYVLKTKPNVVHAEDNLIQFAKEHDIDLRGCTLYITHSPCPTCGIKIIDAGFTEVVFEKYYRVESKLEGILVRQWKT